MPKSEAITVQEKAQPTFSSHLFWDCDATKLDFEARWKFVIVRALTYGKWVDVQTTFRLYGPRKVKKALLEARDLDAKTLHFWANYFQTPIERFRCYDLMRLNPAPWQH